MRPAAKPMQVFRQPQLIRKAVQLDSELKQLSALQIQTLMKISPKLAEKTKALISKWTDTPGPQRAAIDSFLGDIYSGMRVQDWTLDDRKYADEHMVILSGLYGLLRPLDGICPYRYEMGYKYPSSKYPSLYSFWGDSIAKRIRADEPIVNLTAMEYSKVLVPSLDQIKFITPVFLTYSVKTNKPEFVTVHTKIARGAFARWIIKGRISKIEDLKNFTDLNYIYDYEASTGYIPVFVCKTFGGIGLSVRLSSD